MATDKSGKITVFHRKTFFDMMPFLNGSEYRNADGQLKSASNADTSCPTVVTIGGVTLKKRLIIFCTFVKKMAKMGISSLLS